MSIDERLRLGLLREAAQVDAGVDEAMELVIRRHRHRRVLRATALTTVAACVALLVTLAVPAWLAREDGTPAAPSAATIIGAYEAAVSGGEAERESIAGRWRMRLEAGGTISLTAPPGYTRPTSGAGYVATSERLTTNMLLDHPGCQAGGAGTYAWSTDGAVLRLEVLDDQCLARALLLSGQEWRRVP